MNKWSAPRKTIQSFYGILFVRTFLTGKGTDSGPQLKHRETFLCVKGG